MSKDTSFKDLEISVDCLDRDFEEWRAVASCPSACITAKGRSKPQAKRNLFD